MDLSQLQIDRKGSAPMRQPKSFWRWIFLGLIVAGIWWFRAPLKNFFVQARLPKVEVADAYRPDLRSQAVASGVSAGGYVVARVRAALSSDVPGRIVEMHVTEGSRVKAGEVVARLAHEEQESRVRVAESNVAVGRSALASAQARSEALRQSIPGLQSAVTNAASSVERAQAEADWAAIELKRMQRLQEQDLGNESDLDNRIRQDRVAKADILSAQATFEGAEFALIRGRAEVASLEAAEKESQATIEQLEAQLGEVRAVLDKTYVRAPFDGVVVLKDAEVGEVVSPNSQGGSSRGSVATLVDLSTLEAQVELPEVRISAIQLGGAAQIYLDAYPDVAMPARVDRIWPTANRQKATVEVRVVFDKLDERVRPEMGLRVVFVGEEQSTGETNEVPQGVRVPSRAVVQRDGAAGVFVLEDDQVRWVTVGEVETLGSEAVLLGDAVPEDARVILAPGSDLKDGDRVRME